MVPGRRRHEKITVGCCLLIALVAGIIGRSTWSGIALDVIIIAIAASRGYVARIKSDSGTEGFRYHLCASARNYLIPVGIATAVFVSMADYIALFGDSLGIGWLSTMQRAFTAVSGFFADHIKLAWGEGVTLLVVTSVVTSLLLARWPAPARDHVPSEVDGVSAARARAVLVIDRVVGDFRKYCGPVGAGLATLAALTFFGGHLSATAHDLQLRVKTIQDAYAGVTRQIRADISENVSSALYDKVRSTFPADDRDGLTLPGRIESAVGPARTTAANDKTIYGISDPAIDETIQDALTAGRRLNSLNSPIVVDDPRPESAATETIDVPGDVSLDQVQNASRNLNVRQKKSIEVVDDGPKKIFLQIETLATARLTTLLDPLTTNVPITKPFIQAFTSAVDTMLQGRLGALYDRMTEQVTRNPGDLDRTIQQDAARLVAQTNVDAEVRSAVPAAEQAISPETTMLTTLNGAGGRLDTEIARQEAAEALPEDPSEDPDHGLFPIIQPPPIEPWPAPVEPYQNEFNLPRYQPPQLPDPPEFTPPEDIDPPFDGFFGF